MQTFNTHGCPQKQLMSGVVLWVQAFKMMKPASGSDLGAAAGYVDAKKQQHAWRC